MTSWMSRKYWPAYRVVIGRQGLFWVSAGTAFALALSWMELLFAFLIAHLILLMGLSGSEPASPTWLPAYFTTRDGILSGLLLLGFVRIVFRIASSQSGVYFQELVHCKFRFVYFSSCLDPEAPRVSLSTSNTYLAEVLPKATGFCGGLVGALNSGTQCVFYMIVLLAKSPLQALACMACTALMAPLIRGLNGRARRVSESIIGDWRTVQSMLLRATRNWLLIRILRAEADELYRLRAASLATTTKSLRVALLSAISSGLPEITGVLIIAIFAYLQFNLRGMSGTGFVIFLYVFLRLIQAMVVFATSLSTLSANAGHFEQASRSVLSDRVERSKAAIEPIRHLAFFGGEASPPRFTPQHRPARPDHAVRVWGDPPEIDVENLYFGYPGDKKPVIQDLSFRLGAGKSLGITGPSGSGKSTLLAIVLGLLKPDSGRAGIGGKPSRELRLEDSLRIGYVGAEPFMVEGSVRENLHYGSKDSFDDETLMATLVLAGFREDGPAMKRLLEAPVSEEGDGLSTGQKQRLCLARALLIRPQLLVLDEVSANLDAQAEALIAETVKDLAGRTTVIIVSHRPAMLRHCDAVQDFGWKPDQAPADGGAE